MSEITIKMLKDGVDFFINEDPKLAKSVCERDNLVDELKDKITVELSNIMSSDPSTVERSLHLLKISAKHGTHSRPFYQYMRRSSVYGSRQGDKTPQGRRNPLIPRGWQQVNGSSGRKNSRKTSANRRECYNTFPLQGLRPFLYILHT